MKKMLLWIAVAASLLVPPAFAEELTIEITQGSSQPILISVVPFKNKSVQAIPEDIPAIVQDDLRRSGEFSPLEVSRMLSLPSREKEVVYRDWRLLGQNYLVVGEIEYKKDEKRYRVRYELLDVNRELQLAGQILSASEKDLRTLAHKISDRVYEEITGIKGVFSTRIAYVTLQRTKKGAEYRLQVADADGRRSEVILQSAHPILSPAWSPDAKKLAYVSFESTRPAIYVQDLNNGERAIVAAYPGLNGAPAWSPDGKSMVVTLSKDGNAELYLMDIETLSLVRLTRHFAIDTEASWSPSGDRIVFTSDRSGRPQIYEMTLSDKRARRLTFEGKYNARPRYTEDGKSIIYVHQSDGVFNIAKLELDSGVQTILTETPLDESPSIAPNGRMLIYGTQRGKRGVLAVVSIDGQTKYFLPSKFGDVREPAWSPYIAR